MELTEEEKQVVKKILSKADGEDMDSIIYDLGFEEYLLRSLVMSASEDDIQYLLEERSRLKNELLSRLKKQM